MGAQTIVEAATHGHGKRVLAVCADQKLSAGMTHTKEHLAEWRYASEPMVRNARTEEISREGVACATAENVAVSVATEISDSTQPMVDVICDRRTAPVQAKALSAGSCRIGTNIGIACENINGLALLCLRGHSEE